MWAQEAPSQLYISASGHLPLLRPSSVGQETGDAEDGSWHQGVVAVVDVAAAAVVDVGPRHRSRASPKSDLRRTGRCCLSFGG